MPGFLPKAPLLSESSKGAFFIAKNAVELMLWWFFNSGLITGLCDIYL